MNPAQVRLLLNPIPIPIPVAFLILVHSLWKSSFPARKFAYVVLIVAAASVLPVYLTGKPEEGVARSAVFAMAATTLIGLASTANLGGKIRQTKLRGEATQPASNSTE